MYKRFFKRPLDFIVSIVTLIVVSPIMLLVAILVRLNLGSPILFRQERPGLNEKIFTLYKFRTMADKKDNLGNLLSDSDRLTRFGRFLRSTSIDELPELWNIFKGDMSIVGPRPLAIQYLPFYTEIERHRHDIKPGLTGLAQVNGRNSLSWEKKFEYDISYVNNITFKDDMHIIFKTVLKVIKRGDIGQAEEAPESLHIMRANKK